jgi:hypothetical protein
MIIGNISRAIQTPYANLETFNLNHKMLIQAGAGYRKIRMAMLVVPPPPRPPLWMSILLP